MEAEISQGHPNALSVTRNVSQKSSGRGGKNKEVGGGTKFKFGQLIIRKIIKIVAARCHILRLKCTKFKFNWGSAPDPARHGWKKSQFKKIKKYDFLFKSDLFLFKSDFF